MAVTLLDARLFLLFHGRVRPRSALRTDRRCVRARGAARRRPQHRQVGLALRRGLTSEPLAKYRRRSGCAAFPLELGGVLKDWVEAPALEGYRSADPRQIVGRGPDRHRAVRAPRDVRQDYHSSCEATGSSSRCAQSKLDVMDAGRFTWEDGADEYAALVTSWWGRRLCQRRIRGSTLIEPATRSRPSRRRAPRQSNHQLKEPIR
jgi:hypothetical protein